MNLNTRQRAIIAGALADVARMKNKQPWRNAWGGLEDVSEQEEIERAKTGIVRTDPARWLGRNLTGGDYVMLSRDYKALESGGLIRRHKLGFRGISFTHIEITEAGRDAVAPSEAPATTDG